MSNSAINTQVAQLKIGNVQNQADNSAVYSGGIWSLKNSTALPSVTITDAGNVGIGTTSPVFKIDTSLGNLSATTAGLRLVTGNIGNLVVGLSQVSTNMGAASTSGDIYTTAALDLRFGTNNAERMRIDASGNVGIGTASPKGSLHTSGNIIVNNGAGFLGNLYYSGSWKYASSGSGLAFGIFSDTTGLSFQTAPGGGTADATATVTERMRIDASGNVGINAVSPTSRLTIGTGTFTAAAAQTTGMYTNGTNGLVVLTDAMSVNSRTGTNFLNIDASGNLLVAGTTLSSLGTTNKGFFVRGDDTNDVYLQVASKGATTKTHAYFYNSSGLGGSIATNSGVISLANGSDYRIKNIIKPIENAVNTVNKLNCVVYEYKQTPGTYFDGFIAHELQEVIPTAVYGEKDAVDENGEIKIQGVDLARLVPVLTKAIQELSAKNEALEARLAALEAK